MLRKLVIAVAAVAAIGTAGLAPTTAEAGWKGKGWGWGHHWGYRHFGYGFAFAPAYYGCVKLVRTPYGWREINVCY
jgi:hypothetical protein